MAKQQKRLGEILAEWKFLNPKEIDKALEHAKSKNLRIGEALIDLKMCNENQVAKALATQYGMEYIDLDKSSVPPNAVNSIPNDIMRKHLILPLGMENGKLRVAIHDPLDLELLDILRFRLGKELRPVLAAKGRIKELSLPTRYRQLLLKLHNHQQSLRLVAKPGTLRLNSLCARHDFLGRLSGGCWCTARTS